MYSKAVVLLSGGLDSAVAAAVAKSNDYDVYALTVDYGQKHQRELQAAQNIGNAIGVQEHKIISVPLNRLGKSSLLQSGSELPTSRSEDEIGKGIPSTYVPARNTILLGLGLAWAESLGADAVFIGAHTIDYPGYPDCRPEFFKAFQKVSELGTKQGVEGKPIEIKTPLLEMSKDKIIKLGNKLKVPFELTWSCYKGGKKACGVCDSCVIRRKAFSQAGMEDPIEYE